MMPVWTPAALGTVALHIRFAWRAIRVQAKAIFTPQKVAEVEAVHGLSNFLDVLIRRHRA